MFTLIAMVRAGGPAQHPSPALTGGGELPRGRPDEPGNRRAGLVQATTEQAEKIIYHMRYAGGLGNIVTALQDYLDMVVPLEEHHLYVERGITRLRAEESRYPQVPYSVPGVEPLPVLRVEQGRRLLEHDARLVHRVPGRIGAAPLAEDHERHVAVAVRLQRAVPDPPDHLAEARIA